MTYIPPLLIAIFVPRAFVLGLSYAGIWCAVLLILLPALMVWAGRSKKLTGSYRFFGSKVILVFLIMTALALMAFAIHLAI